MPQALAEPQTIKISSKRQITIPAKAYKELNFSNYALCTVTDEGILIRPLAVDKEDISVGILRDLIHQGYEGEELINRYAEEQRKHSALFKDLIDQTEKELQNADNFGHDLDDLFKD